MSHDTSIHVYEVGATLSAFDFQHYIAEWGCSPMQYVHPDPRKRKPGDGDGSEFICMREANGYTETWKATHMESDGKITELVRTA